MPEGLLSTHLVRGLKPGTIVRLAPPRGEFVLPDPPPPKLLYLTGGSGITPVMAMLRTMDRRGPMPDAVHVHSAPDVDVALFRDELHELTRRHPGFDLHERFTRRDGQLSLPLDLQRACPDWREREAWVCGPSAMLDEAEKVWADGGRSGSLLVTAYRLLRSRAEPDQQYRENAALRMLRTLLPVTDTYHGARTTVKLDGKRWITPLLVVMAAIGTTDLLFALDSMPAIFGLTTQLYLVFTANAFVLMGLRQLYFLLGGLVPRLVYLSYGLGVILAFIGVKLVLEALHENELPLLNGGDPVPVPEIGTAVSLAVIAGVLAVTTWPACSWVGAFLARSRATPPTGPVAVER